MATVGGSVAKASPDGRGQEDNKPVAEVTESGGRTGRPDAAERRGHSAAAGRAEARTEAPPSLASPRPCSPPHHQARKPKILLGKKEKTEKGSRLSLSLYGAPRSPQAR